MQLNVSYLSLDSSTITAYLSGLDDVSLIVEACLTILLCAYWILPATKFWNVKLASFLRFAIAPLLIIFFAIFVNRVAELLSKY
jgi:hypothetical protein